MAIELTLGGTVSSAINNTCLPVHLPLLVHTRALSGLSHLLLGGLHFLLIILKEHSETVLVGLHNGQFSSIFHFPTKTITYLSL